MKRASKRNDRVGALELKYPGVPSGSLTAVNDGQEKRSERPSSGWAIVFPTPLRQRRVRTLLPPTRTSQLNVYEASGVDKAFGHKYELSAVNAPSRTEVE